MEVTSTAILDKIRQLSKSTREPAPPTKHLGVDTLSLIFRVEMPTIMEHLKTIEADGHIDIHATQGRSNHTNVVYVSLK